MNKNHCMNAQGAAKCIFAELLVAIKAAKQAKGAQIVGNKAKFVVAVFLCSQCEQWHQTAVKEGQLVGVAKNGILVQVGFGCTPKQVANAAAQFAAIG